MRPLNGIKVLIGTSSFAQADKAPLALMEREGIEVVPNPFKRKLTKDELTSLLRRDITGIIAGLETLDREVIAVSALKVISRCGSGMSNVDVDAAADKGVLVYRTPDAPTNAVAELTIGALLSLLRGIPRMSHALRDRRWEKHLGVELAGRTFVVVGFGRIGRKVARLAAAFDCHVLAVDPFLEGVVDGVPVITMDEALAKADIMGFHASGEQELMGEAEFARLKKGCYLLNSGRGGLVNEQALAKALDQGTVAGAWLDTFVDEPYQGPLCDYPQVVLTPHVGSYSVEGRLRMEMEAAQNLIDGLKNI